MQAGRKPADYHNDNWLFTKHSG